MADPLVELNDIYALISDRPTGYSQARPITYGFLTSFPGLATYAGFSEPPASLFGVDDTGNIAFYSLNDQSRDAARAVLREIGRITGLTFQEVDLSSPGAVAPDIRFGLADLINSGRPAAGRNFRLPTTAPTPLNDIYLDTTYAVLNPGSDSYVTLMQEVGHALGLKHPNMSAPRLDPERDNLSTTVMTDSWDFPTQAFLSASSRFPVSPLVLDMAALQWLYGPNGGTGEGAIHYAGNEYRFAPGGAVTADPFQINGG